jgi:hypothetical protein
LEYLIRQYHIERLNVDALMDCCLLFHDTPFFAKLLKIVNLDAPGSMWSFLKTSRDRSEALPRSALAERAAHDPSLLAFLGSMLFSAADLSPENSLQPTSQAWQARVSWYAATVAAAVEARAPSEDFLRALLPQLVKGTALKAAPSVQAGCYMVAIKVAMSQSLSKDASELLLTVVMKTHAPQFASHAFACAFALSVGLEALPSDAVNAFLNTVPLPVESLAVAAERIDGTHFMHLLLASLLHRLSADPTPIAEAICELIRVELPVGAVIQKVVLRALLLAADEGVSQKAAAVAMVAKCASCYARETDEAVRGALVQLQGSAKAAALAALTQTPSMRLQPAGDLGTSIWLALEHSDAEMRSKAVVHVLDLEDVSEDLAPALLRRLNDSSPQVVASFSTHPKAPALLVRCCSDSSERLSLLEKAVRHWSQEWIRDPEVSAPALSGLLSFLVEVPDLEATAVATTLIGHFPAKAGVQRAAKLRASVQNALAMVWASALTGAVSLCKSSGFALFKRVVAPPSRGPKKGQFETTCMEWAIAASDALASSLFEKSSGGAYILEAETFCLLTPLTQAKLMEALAVAVRSSSGQSSAATECAMQLLKETLPVLSGADHDLKSAALDLCVAVVPQEAPQSKGASWSSSGDLLAHLLELAPAVFAEPSAQEALRQMLALHVDQSSPLPFLAAIFAPPVEASNHLAPVRALSVANTFVSALTSGSAVSQAAQERALQDAGFILLHVLAVLQHSDKVVRQAGLGVLIAMDGCGNSAGLKKMTVKVPLAPGNPVKDAITLSGADLFKFCGSLVARDAELLMDSNALSSVLADLFLQDSLDRAWKKARSPCLAFLIAHAANLTFAPGSQHVGASVLAIMGRGDSSVLKSHVKVAWPYCEAAATEALSRASKNSTKLTWAIEVLRACANSFVFTGGPVSAPAFALVVAMLNAVATSRQDPSPSLRVIAKHVLRSTTKGFCAQLNQPQVEELFVATLAAGRSLPSKSAMMRSALDHLSPSPQTLAQLVKAAASCKGEWLPAASFTLIALDLPLANFIDSASTLDPLLPLLDEINALLVRCHQAAGVDSSEEEVAFCIGLACNLASQLLNSSSSSFKPFKKLHARASAYADTLRTCVESGKQPVRVTSAATQFLAALASRCPQEMTSSIVGMVQQLSRFAAADEDDDSLFDCTQLVLRSVLPHLRESGDSVGALLRDLVQAFEEGSGSRRLAICATLLQVLI